MQQQVIVFAFSKRRLAEFAAVAPRIPRFALLDQPDWNSTAVTVGGLGVNYRHLRSRRRVARLHQRGWKVFAWTVNQPAVMRRLMSWGVDGLITNYPDRALCERRRTRTAADGNGGAS